MQRFNHKKGIQAANHFALQAGGQISKIFVCKLIWLADRLHLRSEGRNITGDSYSALENGPVPSRTLNIINKKTGWVTDREIAYRDQFIDFANGYSGLVQSIQEPNLKVFSKTDREAMDQVFIRFGNYGLGLSDIIKLSHQYPEWKRYEADINDPRKPDGYPIINEDFFLPSEVEDDFFTADPTELELTQDLFLEHEEIYNIFAK